MKSKIFLPKVEGYRSLKWSRQLSRRKVKSEMFLPEVEGKNEKKKTSLTIKQTESEE